MTRFRKKVGTYKKPNKDQEKKFKLLDDVIRGYYKIDNKLLIEKLDVSKTTFYRKYKVKADELKKYYSSMALF